MSSGGLTIWTVVLDSLGLMLCIGAVLLARRMGRTTAAAAPVAVGFGAAVDRESVRQQIASAFAAIVDCIDAERQSMDAVFTDGCRPLPARRVPAPNGPPSLGGAPDAEAAMMRMADQGFDAPAIAQALERPPAEVALSLKLRRGAAGR